MKSLFKSIILMLLLTNCGSDDDNSNSTDNNLLLGQWRFTSGSLVEGDDMFVNFNSDNTLVVLRETNLNFKRIFKTNYTISENQISIDGLSQNGTDIFDYVLENEILTIGTQATLQKTNTGPEISSWIQELSILNSGNPFWGGNIDMAFNYDKTQIVYGNGNQSNYISLIDKNTFEETGLIETTRNSYAVEVEKFDLQDRYVFQSDGNSNLFYGYFENSNMLDITSPELGNRINGLASVDRNSIWAASSNEARLYLFNYNDNTIENEFAVDIRPAGLDYQDGFLFISDGNSFHKCQTFPAFEVLESYYIENIAVTGIAYDGTNFWVNGYDYVNDEYKIIQTNLTL